MGHAERVLRGHRRARPKRAPAHVNPLLRIVDVLRPLYTLRGIEYPVFRELLRARLVLDGRRMGKKDGSLGLGRNVGFLGMLGLLLCAGLVVGLFAFFVQDGENGPFVFGTIATSLLVYMVAMSLLMDFSAVLLDTTDVKLLEALPVQNEAVLAARTTHVAAYVLLLVASCLAMPLLFGAFAFPALRHLVGLLVAALLTTGMTFGGVVVLYLVALRRLDLTRFKDAMLWVQVGGMAVFYLGSQVLPRVFMHLSETGWLERNPWLFWLYPPAWTGAIYHAVVSGPRPGDGVLLTLGVAVPLVVLALGSLLARRRFVERLGALADTGGPRRSEHKRRGITGRLCERWTRPGPERAGYRFFLEGSAVERVFRLRTAPLLLVLLVPIVMPLLSGPDVETGDVALLLLPYLCMLPLVLVPIVFEAARFSDTHEARWCFDLLDDDEFEQVALGMTKAVVVRYLFLPVLLFGLLAVGVVGPSAVGTTLLTAGLTLLGVRWVVDKVGGIVPFTEPYSFARSQSASGTMLVLMLGTAAAIGAVALIGRVEYASLAAGPVALFFGVRGWRGLDRLRVRLRQTHVVMR
jgi:hypothetical protein